MYHNSIGSSKLDRLYQIKYFSSECGWESSAAGRHLRRPHEGPWARAGPQRRPRQRPMQEILYGTNTIKLFAVTNNALHNSIDFNS